MAESPFVELEVGERTVKVTNPDKVFFRTRGETKLDLVRYYLAVGDGIVRALHERPTQLKRHPDGAEGEAIYQKRVPKHRPDWIETATVTFPSGRTADELCVTELAQVAWAANLGTIDFHPWPSRRADVEHPDELRIDVDPQPGTGFAEAKQVAAIVREALDELGFDGLAEDLGQPRHPRRVPDRAEVGLPRGAPLRARVRARDRAARSPTSSRPPGGRRSAARRSSSTTTRTPATARSPPPTPLGRGRTGRCRRRSAGTSSTRSRPRTSRSRRCRRASPSWATCRPGSTTPSATCARLLEWVEREEAAGEGEAPYPPNFPKMPGEPKRVQPSRAKKESE